MCVAKLLDRACLHKWPTEKLIEAWANELHFGKFWTSFAQSAGLIGWAAAPGCRDARSMSMLTLLKLVRN